MRTTNTPRRAYPAPTPPFDGTEACRGAADVFFKSDRASLKQARALCATCPLIEACGEWAIHFEDYGFWAGTTPRQRKKIRKERGIKLIRPEAQVPRPRSVLAVA